METIKEYINKILKFYENGKFSDFINNLLLLKNEAAKYDPENMSLNLVDFLMDENMFDWVVQSFNKEQPNDFDWEAAYYIANDLKDMIKEQQ